MSEPEQMAILMGLDAMRLCMGLPTRNYTREEVLKWIECMKNAEIVND